MMSRAHTSAEVSATTGRAGRSEHHLKRGAAGHHGQHQHCQHDHHAAPLRPVAAAGGGVHADLHTQLALLHAIDDPRRIARDRSPAEIDRTWHSVADQVTRTLRAQGHISDEEQGPDVAKCRMLYAEIMRWRCSRDPNALGTGAATAISGLKMQPHVELERLLEVHVAYWDAEAARDMAGRKRLQAADGDDDSSEYPGNAHDCDDPMNGMMLPPPPPSSSDHSGAQPRHVRTKRARKDAGKCPLGGQGQGNDGEESGDSQIQHEAHVMAQELAARRAREAMQQQAWQEYVRLQQHALDEGGGPVEPENHRAWFTKFRTNLMRLIRPHARSSPS